MGQLHALRLLFPDAWGDLAYVDILVPFAPPVNFRPPPKAQKKQVYFFAKYP
jgi:hypothetical protein